MLELLCAKYLLAGVSAGCLARIIFSLQLLYAFTEHYINGLIYVL